MVYLNMLPFKRFKRRCCFNTFHFYLLNKCSLLLSEFQPVRDFSAFFLPRLFDLICWGWYVQASNPSKSNQIKSNLSDRNRQSGKDKLDLDIFVGVLL
jgi:hypothetical protein